MKKLMIVMAFLLGPGVASADSLDIYPGEPLPNFDKKIILSYKDREKNLMTPCVKATRILGKNGFSHSVVKRVDIDPVHGIVKCTVEGRSK